MSLLVTGFGPFLDIKENPSGTLASSLGEPFRILPVSFQAADEFLSEDLWEVDRILMLGVSAKARTLKLEMFAKNEIGLTPDVDGDTRPGVIEIGAPTKLGATLLPTRAPKGFGLSFDAGSYLCNYLSYRALQRHPEKRIGFVHVPPFERVPFEEQLARLQSLLPRLNG